MTTTPKADLVAQADRRDLGLVEALRARDAEGLTLGLKLPEAAKMLGVSQRHLYNQVNARMVPCYWIGKALRFSPVALREWVAKESADSVAWQSAASLLAASRALEARLLADRQRPVDPDAGFVPAPKTVHVRRAGEWVTELPSTFAE